MPGVHGTSPEYAAQNRSAFGSKSPEAALQLRGGLARFRGAALVAPLPPISLAANLERRAAGLVPDAEARLVRVTKFWG